MWKRLLPFALEHVYIDAQTTILKLLRGLKQSLIRILIRPVDRVSLVLKAVALFSGLFEVNRILHILAAHLFPHGATAPHVGFWWLVLWLLSIVWVVLSGLLWVKATIKRILAMIRRRTSSRTRTRLYLFFSPVSSHRSWRSPAWRI
ncbi:hypothetical protein [Alicyclobacillus sp. SP_1]|uniref:hypothetical protein n=1 Tax=Alicyclobacillus sp. SP_1 TaxID=2942475 RepID=UPI0021578215|nr:hypothetical protein [Alicyclobacillus sp. SP_1]